VTILMVPANTDRERGIALVTVLWGTFLSVVALTLVVAGRGQTRIGRNIAEGARQSARPMLASTAQSPRSP